jgi:enamine deaminase RidA (YjgF/YER057c/UK114 family)
MTRRLISTGSPFKQMAGYSRAVVQEPWCFMAGTTGYDYTAMTMPEDVGAQAQAALATIARTLEQAGFDLADVVRVTYVVTDPSDAEPVLAVAGATFAHIRPAAMILVAGLLKPEMKVEIEVTALRR